MFDEFLQELQRLRWDQVLTRLPEKWIDVALVKEFYSFRSCFQGAPSTFRTNRPPGVHKAERMAS